MNRATSNREQQTPLYYAIFDQLRREILSGKLAVGEALPSEASLMRRFSVSRHTVREALRQLKEVDLVESRQGSPTVVLGAGKPHQYVYRLNDVRDMHDKDVKTVYDQQTQRMPLAGRLEQFVLSDDKARWLKVTGVRYLTGETTPICAFALFIAPPFAEVADFLGTQRGPVYALIESKFGERIDDVHQWIRAFKASSDTDRRIGLDEGETGIEIQRVFRTLSGDPCMISINNYRADNFLISMKLSRDAREP